MRHDRFARPGMAVLVLCLSLPLPSCAHRTQQGGCGRSIDADVATARHRLTKGQLDEAQLYIEGVLACPGATESLALLGVAYEIYENLGRLGEAWSVARRAEDLSRSMSPEVAADAQGRLLRFRRTYALLDTTAAGVPRNVSYAGPTVDDATAAQVDAARTGEAAQVDSQRWGYWFFPGTYVVDGETRELRPLEAQ